MNHGLGRAVCIALLAILVFPAHATSSENTRVAREVWEALESSGSVEVVVAWKRPALHGRSKMVRTIAATRARILDAVPSGGFVPTQSWTALPGMAGLVNIEGLAALADNPDVLAVSIPGYGTAHLAQSVPLIGADTVQAGGNTGSGTEVTIIDSGARSTHTDLSADLVAGQCFCTSAGTCCPDGSGSQSGMAAIVETTGHGTNVASIITSDGNAASVGVAPDANVSVVRIFNNGGTFRFADLISALDWILNNRLSTVSVVNMSIGSFTLHSGICDQDGGAYAAEYLLISTAIDMLREAGVLAVCSAGNNGSDAAMSMPACLRNTLAVGATYDANVGGYSWSGVCTDSTTAADQYACWSNISAHTDIAAPGCKSTAAWYQGDQQIGWWCGTSQATPHVAGVAALIKSEYPFQSAYHIEHCLRSSPSSITEAGQSLPLLDAANAVATCGFHFVSQILDLKKVVVSFKKTNNPADDKLLVKSSFTPMAAFDPLTEALTFAMEDSDGEVISMTVPAAAAGWSSRRAGRYKYKDRQGAQRGVTKAVVNESHRSPGTYKLLLKAANTSLWRADTTSGVFIHILAGTNLLAGVPSSCVLKPGKKLVCK